MDWQRQTITVLKKSGAALWVWAGTYSTQRRFIAANLNSRRVKQAGDGRQELRIVLQPGRRVTRVSGWKRERDNEWELSEINFNFGNFYELGRFEYF